jgi:two-component system sensor histidine kinase/response regulator
MVKSVLVVEDREIERAGMESLLRSHGYEVMTAPDGATALDLLAGRQPDLITLDMLMPASDGWHFLKERMETPALMRIPVLLVTGLPIATEAWAQDISANGLVKKPVDVDELIRKVELLAGS